MRISRKPILLVLAIMAVIAVAYIARNFFGSQQPLFPSQPPSATEEQTPPPLKLDEREGVVTLNIPGGFGLQREDGVEVFIQVDEKTSFTKSGGDKPPKVFAAKDIKVGDKVSVVSVPDQGGLRALTIVLLP